MTMPRPKAHLHIKSISYVALVSTCQKITSQKSAALQDNKAEYPPSGLVTQWYGAQIN